MAQRLSCMPSKGVEFTQQQGAAQNKQLLRVPHTPLMLFRLKKAFARYGSPASASIMSATLPRSGLGGMLLRRSRPAWACHCGWMWGQQVGGLMCGAPLRQAAAGRLCSDQLQRCASHADHAAVREFDGLAIDALPAGNRWRGSRSWRRQYTA